jgi:hypothetical protein
MNCVRSAKFNYDKAAAQQYLIGGSRLRFMMIRKYDAHSRENLHARLIYKLEATTFTFDARCIVYV